MATESESTKPVVLYTQGTPNGWVASIILEELKLAYGAPDYDWVALSIRDADIGKIHDQVKSEWFLKINPNGRIPAILHNGFTVFETSAILLYLTAQFDKEFKFSADPVNNPLEYSEDLQWIFFAHGGIGPMQGQANHFNLAAPEKIPYAINRYLEETKRLYRVLEKRLEDHDYLVGPGKGRYGIADIKGFSWVRIASYTGVEMTKETFPNIVAWLDRIHARPAVQAGLKVPSKSD